MRKIERILISAADGERLNRLIRDRNTPQKIVWRARIVHLAGDGLSATAIAAAVGKSVLTVRRWRRRYEAKGVDGLLKDATRPPRRKPLTVEAINRVVHMTLHETPPNATHWSVRRLAAAAGLSPGSPAHLGCAWTEAASSQDVQGVARQELRRQGRGRGRALSQSAGQGAGAVRRRKEPDLGARPHPARPAHEEGPRRDDDPRL
jgi:transposase